MLVAALALVINAVFVAVITDRQAMKKENAKDVGTLVKMVKGGLHSMPSPFWLH